MENKNNIFSFHPIGSSQGSGARKKKKKDFLNLRIYAKKGSDI